ncbi:hypothetical protein CC86DRAFT_297584 [Ophiobolus disseminans]|uniref:Uncharacterized protein n=1 Tax=Ophiobolus disseminans TaxID=1469910 RepID=A0A6A6ZTY8_9PLEO|nr:hypothetical protein CC86DRAFT_297584 [Ophiobolus disseminans]
MALLRDKAQSNADKLQNSRTERTSCAAFLYVCHRQAHEDIRTRWRVAGVRCLVVLWLAGLCLSLAILVQLSITSGIGKLGYERLVACQPNGVFDLYPENYRYWSRSGFFEITLGFGKLSFTEAKVIDVIWDIGCGRGGQAIVAFISWHVFAKYVTTSMEIATITFSTYRTVFLQNDSLIFGLSRLLRDFTRRQGLQSKLAMAFMIATMIWILIFPSFASAMTGYSGNVKSYVQDDDKYILFDNFRRIMYVVRDGWRIRQMGNYIVPYESFSDVTSYGFNGLANASSSFLGIILSPPVLNISAYYLAHDDLGAGWLDPSQQQPFRNTSWSMWVHGNATYNMKYITEHGACQPAEVRYNSTYRWGFSFVQLTIMTILCTLWTIGICILWTHTHFIMKRRGHSDVAGEYEAIIELAHAMGSQIGRAESVEVLSLTEAGLRRRIRGQLDGGRIGYEYKCTAEEEMGANGDACLSRWIRKEIWWLVFIFLSTSVMFLIPLLMNGVLAWVPAGLLITLLLTLCIGTTGRSRGVMFFWLFMFLCILPLIVSLLVKFFKIRPLRD